MHVFQYGGDPYGGDPSHKNKSYDMAMCGNYVLTPSHEKSPHPRESDELLCTYVSYWQLRVFYVEWWF